MNHEQTYHHAFVYCSGVAAVVAITLVVWSPWEAHRSEYVGEVSREVKTLSPEDLEELRTGGGWGLALAAELNGVPGPAHLLPMAEEIGLTPDVVQEIEQIYSRMQSQAIPLGERLIELERELNRQFAQGTITEDSLRALTGEIAEITGNLRFVHLQTHLSTPELLSDDQIAQYNQLRGYGPGQGHGEGHVH